MLKPRRRRRKFTRQELLDYLKNNDIRSWRILEKKRIDGDPIPNDYRREFGSWRASLDEAFGKSPVPVEIDVDFVLKSIPYFNAWTYKNYINARKTSPDVLPSIYFVFKNFGKFKNFISFAREKSLEKTLEDYSVLVRKLGRSPTIDECRAAKLRIDFSSSFLKRKSGLDDLVDLIEGRKIPRRRKIKNEKP